MRLLQELTEAKGVSGYEQEVRDIMYRELKKVDAVIQTDHLGSIFGEKQGGSATPRIMLAGHLDEVGFMVTEITKQGYLRFTPLGGWWEQVLLSQRVSIVGENRVFTGVIGSKPPHILTAEERNKVYPMREMFIDVGAHSDEQVKEWGIRVGDPVIPICPFEILPDNDTILAKALDNRVGCYLAAEVINQLKVENHPNTIIAGATVQEEVGLRGATTAPYQVDPDVAFALDVGVAEDGPGAGGDNKAKLGKGPLITFLDATMIPNIKLRNLVIEIAEKKNIPYQVDTMMGGGTDAGRFHLFRRGVPSLVIGVAARYIHSHVSMVSKQDVENAVRLLVEVVKELDEERVKGLTRYT
ncbi:M42 family metallopeptidase [Paenactinomyces guangxiensis]|uniref:M42 family metallopeptidase n=1 Tax=Paenactinomyces guangxiensis TaxID=1490290 RepID=A0A7W1WNJ8_9BACL|nr:M42 family metallopeptidase [Paenactinomyces guangxiensis]MBA4493197.1 M42 family metallopeptidase [Paenactinomyces guangxiensis]MBH8589953.1 M42 family metallopeptidase [Paenactinomyces guangxiensis]